MIPTLAYCSALSDYAVMRKGGNIVETDVKPADDKPTQSDSASNEDVERAKNAEQTKQGEQQTQNDQTRRGDERTNS